MTKQETFWTKIIGEDWYNHLNYLNSDEMLKLMEFIGKDYKTSLIYPDSKEIFKAFKLCKFSDVKVIIIGEDPYKQKISNDGIPFSNRDSVLELSPEMKKIRQCVERDCYDGLKLDFDVTLESWAKQGVLLLNTSLTYKQYNPEAHRKVWARFIREVIISLNQLPGFHFCFWGEFAQNFTQFVDEEKHFKYQCELPSTAHNEMRDWHCNHFAMINKNIIEQNGEEEIIVW